MLFHEMYSLTYQAVSKILTLACKQPLSQKDLYRIIEETAFAESALEIAPSIQKEEWQLLKGGRSVLRHAPDTPLSTLQKRWLKAMLQDPRVKLFELPPVEGLENVQPLFTSDDYKVYDAYADGDPYEDEGYVARFRTVLQAVRQKSPVECFVKSKTGGLARAVFYPTVVEYSPKDDKFRVQGKGYRYSQFNLARITDCKICSAPVSPRKSAPAIPICEVVLRIYDERNALERVLLHFAHYEKRVTKEKDGSYLLFINYHQDDETELVIRVLSFGARVKVEAPSQFRGLVAARLRAQAAFRRPH